MTEDPKTIVAEITKNWLDGYSDSPLLATQFEGVIEVNRIRGYRLKMFQFHQIMTSDRSMAETIIAVFTRLS